MFPKSKILFILVVISLYSAGVFLSYSGDLFGQIQKIRHENYIKKIKFSETISFSLEEWKSFSDKTEIKHNDVYYDVISFQNFHSKVIVKVVKDSSESEFRMVFQNIFNKNSIPNSGKKKTSKPYNSLTEISNETKTNSISVVSHYFFKSNFPFLNIKTNKIVKAVHRPPC